MEPHFDAIKTLLFINLPRQTTNEICNLLQPFNKKLGIAIGYINVSLLSAKKNYSEAHQQTVTQPVIRLSDEDAVVLTSTKSIAVRLQKILVSMRIAEEHLADATSQVPSVVVTELRNLRRVTSSLHITAKQCRERESWLSYFNMSPTTDSHISVPKGGHCPHREFRQWDQYASGLASVGSKVCAPFSISQPYITGARFDEHPGNIDYEGTR
ncbi:hypothetical protein FRB91_001865 [Serendipita sp. 411]|nr:hypothetical protein FRB91_001865 [Serendipita sp. 411]